MYLQWRMLDKLQNTPGYLQVLLVRVLKLTELLHRPPALGVRLELVGETGGGAGGLPGHEPNSVSELNKENKQCDTKCIVSLPCPSRTPPLE